LAKKPKIDGFYVREARITPSEGAPFPEVRLVIHRATRLENRHISECATRLLQAMGEARRDGVRIERGAVIAPAIVQNQVKNFAMCVAQIDTLEGVPGFDEDDWAGFDTGADTRRLLELFDRWSALDGGLVWQIENAVERVDRAPALVMDPNSREPSADG
jgi:hypothetical protein